MVSGEVKLVINFFLTVLWRILTAWSLCIQISAMWHALRKCWYNSDLHHDEAEPSMFFMGKRKTALFPRNLCFLESCCSCIVNFFDFLKLNIWQANLSILAKLSLISSDCVARLIGFSIKSLVLLKISTRPQKLMAEEVLYCGT